MNRCIGQMANGAQCSLDAQEGDRFCSKHNPLFKVHQAKKSLDQYRIAKYQTRLNDFKNNDQLKSLRDEIGLLRILIEEQFNNCDSPAQLLMRTPVIADLIIKAEKVVSSCQRIETQTGSMLDKNQALQFATEIINIIDTSIDNKDLVNNIANKMFLALERISNTPKSEE